MKRTTMLVVPTLLALLVVAGTGWAANGGTPRLASLTGAAEVPAADPDGSGSAVIRVNFGHKRVCWQLSVKNITLPAAAAHIHVGATGTNGPVKVTLGAPDGSGKSAGCVTVEDKSLLKALIQSPSGYYVNVHTTDYPGGALRGQLGKPGSGRSGGKPDVKPGKPVK